MLDALRLYRRYVGISIRSQMQYPTSFLLQSLGILLVTGIEFLGMWALFDRFGNLRGWTLPEAAFFYGLINITFAFADALARGFDTFGGMIRAGDFDRVLLRPRSTVLQLCGQELTLRRVGRLIQGLAVLLWASHALAIPWGMLRVALVLLAIAGGVCLFFALVMLQATMCFWTTESLEIMNVMTYGGVHAGQYPITIYRPWFRRFFTTIVPLACVTYYPALAVLGKPDPLGSALWVQCLAPMAGLLFLLVSLQAWRIGVRHYRSTGS